MKKNTHLFIFLFTCFIQISFSQTIIHSENFEGADLIGYAIGNGNTNTDYANQAFATSSDNNDFFRRGLASSFPFGTPVTGNTTNMIAGEDLDFTTAPVFDGHSYLRLNPITITGKTNLTIDIDVAFPNNTINRYEPTRFLIVEYRLDGAGAYTQALAFYGNASGIGLFRDTNLNGIKDAGETTDVTSAMTNFSVDLNTIAGFTVTGNTIEIRVRINMPDSHEEFAFDNIILKGIDAPCTDPTVPTVTATANPVCSGGSTTLNIAGTLNDATQWAIYTGSCGGSLVGTTTSSSFMVTPTGPSTTYYVRGEGGCVTPGSCGTLTVNVNTITITPASQTNVSCFGGANGAASINTPTGGTAPYSYDWTPGNPSGDGTASISGLSAGTYTCTVTDMNGCTATQNFTITQPSTLNSSVSSQTNIACNGAATGAATVVAFGGTPGYTYSWAPSGGTAATATGLSAGTYTCTITDANGCTKTQSVTLTQPTAITSSISSQTNVSCNGGTNGAATVSASGGTTPYTYLWSNGATTASINGLAAGTYNVTITDANGCTKTQSVTITQPTAITATISAQSNVLCNGESNGSGTVSVTGGTPPYTYIWNDGTTTATINGLAAGTYNVIITDANGCTSNTSMTITQPTVLVANAAVTSNYNGSQISCNGAADGSATAFATGGTAPYTYVWNNGATTAVISDIAPGTYNVTITDANGCTDTASITITEPTALVASAVIDNNVSCNGATDGAGTASITGGTAPYTYVWNNGATTASITGVTAGTYNVTITDANGCTDTASITVTEPTALVASAVIDNNVSCNGDTDGAGTASITGGTAPYTYAWSNGATTASITGIAAGTYNVTITDANGCTDTASITVTEPTAIDNTISESTTGILTANEASATYQWYECPNTLLTGETNQNFEPTALGNYKVQITVGTCVVESACYTVTTLDNEGFNNDIKFVIYPNPTNGLLNINTDLDGQFIIVNQLGQTVKIFNVSSTITNIINVENLADGIYFIKGTNGLNTSSKRLIIKK